MKLLKNMLNALKNMMTRLVNAAARSEEACLDAGLYTMPYDCYLTNMI